MIETTVTVSVTETVLDDDEAFIELWHWAKGKEGIYCTLSTRVDGTTAAEIGGVTVDTVYVNAGDTLSYDGTRFTVTSPEVEPEPEHDPFDTTPTDVSATWGIA